MATELIQTADLHFRSYLHTVMPLHESLVAEMCAQPKPPLELATILEDIGQQYMALADRLARALIEKDHLVEEADTDAATEAQLDRFVEAVIAKADVVSFRDGTTVTGSEALNAFPFVAGAIRTAVLLARSGKTQLTD